MSQIAKGDPEHYRQAHARLDEVLGGSGPLAERMAAHRERRGDSAGPPGGMHPRVLQRAARQRPGRATRCPTRETIIYEVVTDKPWSGFNYYLGDYRSTVAVNADLKQQMSNLPRLVAHESYPGHHTEHCRKEAGWWPGEVSRSRPSSWSTPRSA